MYPELDAIFRRYLSGARAQGSTAALTEHYRSPGSSGYHAATQYVAAAIREAGADEVIEERYPLDGQTKFLGRTMPPAWEPLSAGLEIVAPVCEHLISYEQIPSTLPWWCGSTPPDGVVVQIVDVGRGLSAADYVGKPVAGNAVLIRDSESRPAWHHAAELARTHGAAGIITDFLHSQTRPWRTRHALPEAVQLLRLPPRWENPWAFSVDYHSAQRLATLAQAGPVSVSARVAARTFKGEGVNLIATIRGAGRPDESVLFIAHTSAGTKPCANCAAGPALMIELCRAIQAAIGDGALPRPRRSIRFLFVAEGLGSTYFIHSHRDTLPKINAALCLDSVGHRQSTLKSSLVMYRSPDSIPSYINDVGAALIEDLPKEADWPFRNGPVIPLVNFHQLPYTPWSDNHYWVTFGVPAPLFMSWPDLYFHTQLLTAEHTDPMVFERAGRMLGSLAVAIARSGPADVGPILREVAAKAALRVARVARDALGEMRSRDGAVLERARGQIDYLVDRDARAIRSAVALAGGGPAARGVRLIANQLVEENAATARREVRRLRGRARAASDSGKKKRKPREGAKMIPRRPHDGVPPGVVGLSYDEMAALVDAMRAEDSRVNWETLRIFGDELWNLSDGHRSLAEIGEAICHEFGFRIGSNHFHVLARGLQKAGLLRL
ncbi:MAG: hypothetical protein ACT4PY_03600 [Armatimonadota bacterium]